jgi:surface protein
MAGMFFNASAFNQDIGNWNTSSVRNMARMFEQANAFNQPIGNWNVSEVTSMNNMFYLAPSFNQPLGKWIMSKVTDISGILGSLFRASFTNAETVGKMAVETSSFNQDISTWDVSSVVNMNGAFANAVVFNQNIGNWNVSEVTDMANMLDYTGISVNNYDSILIGWAAQPLQYGVTLGAEGLVYSRVAIPALITLSQKYGWKIEGGSGPPISNTCFPKNTPICTDQGDIAIDKIDSSIHTIRGYSIVAVCQTVSPDKYLVCFEKDALAPNVPSQKTVCSKNHLIFYQGKMRPANDFLYQFDKVKRIKYTGEVLYNILLKEHGKMMVNNLICETLHPENSIAKLYKRLETMTPEQQNKFIQKYNKAVSENKTFSPKK